MERTVKCKKCHFKSFNKFKCKNVNGEKRKVSANNQNSLLWKKGSKDQKDFQTHRYDITLSKTGLLEPLSYLYE